MCLSFGCAISWQVQHKENIPVYTCPANSICLLARPCTVFDNQHRIRCCVAHHSCTGEKFVEITSFRLQQSHGGAFTGNNWQNRTYPFRARCKLFREISKTPHTLFMCVILVASLHVLHHLHVVFVGTSSFYFYGA